MQIRRTPTSPTPYLAGRVLWWLYNVGMLLGLLLCLPLLVALALASKKRRQTLRQRLGAGGCGGRSASAASGPAIWVHALSVGEVTAAQPLVQGLRNRYPHQRIVLTASTFTGYETACRMFSDPFIALAYFPYDLIFSVRAAATRIDPMLVILIETDIWPNFLFEIKRRKIPLMLANFRLSDHTWRKCRFFKGLAGNLFESFDQIWAQTREDARRLRSLGVSPQRIGVTGNLKFDTADRRSTGELDRHWRRRLGIESRRPVIVAGSTHAGDEAVLLKALASLGPSAPKATLIIAPRDPGRSRSIVTLCRDFRMSSRGLSELQSDSSLACPDVVVVDYLGALKELYSLATVAFIGGSLSGEGGHNPLEPAVHGKPIVFGPDMRDFRQIAAWLLQMKGARQISDSGQLRSVLLELLSDPGAAQSMGLRSLAVLQNHQGAVTRMLDHLELG